MSAAIIFHFAGAACSGALAVATLFRAGRSLPRWAFAAGMAILSVESVFVALSQATESSAEALSWQTWRLVAMAFLPSAWLLFSLTYARGKETSILASSLYRYVIAAAVLLPVGMALGFRDQLAVSVHALVGHYPAN